MINKKYIFLALFLIAFKGFTQSIDPSIINSLTPQQIEQLKSAYESGNSFSNTREEDTAILTTEESLQSRINEKGRNIAPSFKKFGYDYFSSMPTSLSAIGDLPLPNDYKISLKDQFGIILSGSKDATFNLSVKLDGTILFPELGSIHVVGLTLQEVKDKLSKLIKQSYIGVNIDVSLQNLSAKKITIVGAVSVPGTYLVNPFSTITGALAYSGGISEIGSLRDIKLIRNNKEIFSFDLYDLLIKGDRSNDIIIEAGDTILIGPASNFVEISGGVRRPATYEILENETIEDIIGFALGFTKVANKSNLSASFLDINEAKITKKTISEMDTSLKNILSIDVFEIITEEKSGIRVYGSIEEPGFYDLKEYNNLSELLKALNFVDVYPWLAVLEQFDDNNLIQSSILFNLNDPSTYSSIKLLPNSRIYFANIYSRSFEVNSMTQELINEYQLRINHQQGTFSLPVFGKYSVQSFINLLGLDMSNVDKKATYISPLDNIVDFVDYKNMQYVAKKYNTVSFRSPVNDLITVSITGAIDYPGTYTLKSDSTLEDLYKLVGNFKKEAFQEGIIFTRQSVRDRQLESINKSRRELNEALLVSTQKGDNIGDINIIRALTSEIDPNNLGRIAGDYKPNSISSINTNLFDGDSIIVPKNPNVINVFGEVLNPISFEYTRDLSVSKAIKNAGGYKDYAKRNSVYVIRANGIIEKVNRNIFAGNTKLEAGDTLVVPRKIITNNPGLEILLPITSILSDFAFSAAAIQTLRDN